jgi:autotransporter-associated beta strand protein
MKAVPSVLTCGIAASLAIFSTGNARAQTNGTWNVNGGSWATAGNWVGNTIAAGTDAIADFSTRNITANSTVNLDGARTVGTLIFQDASTASNDWTLATGSGGPLTLDVNSGQAEIRVLNRTLTISAVIVGNDGIMVNTGGTTAATLALSGVNTFSGGLTVNTGATVQLNNASAAGAGTITVATSTNTGISNKVTIAGGVTIPNSFVLEAGAAPTAGVGLIQQTGTGQATVTGAIQINGGAANGGHFVGGAASGNELVINGVITAAPGTAVAQRLGRVIYRGGGTGYTDMFATGTVLVGVTDGLATTATLNLAQSAAATLDLNGFDQTLVGLNLGSTDANNAASVATVNLGARTLTLTGGITTRGSVGHSINGTGNLVLTGTNAMINVTETAAANDLAINAPMIANAGIEKDGLGNLALNGAGHSITGGATVNFGTLSINGSATVNGGATVTSGTLSINGTATVNGGVNVAGGTLTGTGTLTGNAGLTTFGSTLTGGLTTVGTVTTAADTIVMPGTSVTGGTLTASSFNFNGGTIINLNVGAGGDLIAGGTVATTGNVTLNAYQIGGALANGTYPLISYAGASPGLSGFTLQPVGHVLGGLIDTGTAIALNVAGNDRVIWTGSSGTAWENTPVQNWKRQSNNAATNYNESDDVIFADGATVTDVDVFANVTPSNITFTNTAGTTYSVNGFGSIVGTAGLTKSGNGTVILRNPNSYTGATTISAGILEIEHTAGGLTGSGVVSIAAPATLKLTSSGSPFTFPRDISGAGTIVIDPFSSAPGIAVGVTISGNNSGFTGQWKLSPTGGSANGTFRTVNTTTTATSLGSGAIDVDAGAQLWMADNQTIASPITISGTGFAETAGGTPIGLGPLTNGVYVGPGTPIFTYGGIGAIRLSAGANLTGNILADGDSKITAYNVTGTISGAISSTSATDTLVVGGGGANTTTIFAGNNTYGKTLINGGSGAATGTHVLQIGANGTTGTLGTGEVVIFGNSLAIGALRFNRSNGYTLAPGQNIIAAAEQSDDLVRTKVISNSPGAGLTFNGNTVDLSDGVNGGTIHVAGNDNGNGVNNAVLNIIGASVVDVGNIFAGEQTNMSGTINQGGTSSVTVIGQFRIGHWPTETSQYNLSGGSLNLTGVPTQFPYQTAGTQETNGGIYLGIDGTGSLTQSGGTVTTNFVVLDNRANTGPAANMPSGVDSYVLNGGSLILTSASGIISRNPTTSVVLNGGIIQAGIGIGPNLDSDRITVGGPATLDTNGANVVTLYGPLAGSGTLQLTGGGTLRTEDGTGTTLNVAGGGMPGGSIGTASIALAAGTILDANRSTGVDVWRGAISGAGSLAKNNTGTLQIVGSGTGFTGSVLVNAGRLDVPTNFAAPSISVAAGAALGGEASIGSVTLGAGSGLFIDAATAGALTVTNLTVNGTTNIDFAVAATAPGPISVLNYTSKTGPGTFALTNAANYRGSSINDNGSSVTLNVTTKNLTWTGATSGVWDTNTTTNWNDGVGPDKFFSGDSVTFGDGPAATGITFAGAVSPWLTTVNSNSAIYTLTSTAGNLLAGPGGLAKSGTSVLTLVGANSYSGRTTITGGTVSIAASTSLGDASATNTIAINGGTLRATANLDLGATRSMTIGAAGASLISGSAVTMTVPGSLSGAGALTIASSATTGGTVVLSGNNSGLSGNVLVTSAGVTATAGTTLRLANDNALVTGAITLTPSSLAGNSTTLDLANVTIGSGVSLTMDSVAASNFRSAFSVSSGNSVWNGPLIMNGTGLNQLTPATGTSLTINGPVTANPGFTGTMFVRGAGTGTVNGTINLPTGTLNKTDGGTWTISSPSVTIANLQVSDGTMKIGANDIFPASQALVVGQGSGTSGNFDLNGFNQTFSSISVFATSTGTDNRITNGGTGTSTLTVNNSSDITYTGRLANGTGVLALTKTGPGTLTLSNGASNYTGNVQVSGGKLTISGQNNALGANNVAGRSVTVTGGATLEFTINNVLGNGVNNNNLPAMKLDAGSTLTATRYNVLGPLTLDGATVTQAATDAGNYEGYQFRGDVTVTGTTPSLIGTSNGKANHLGPNNTFNVADVTSSPQTDLVISAPLRNQSGDFGNAVGGLTKIGAGTLELLAANTYTGSTVVNGGVLLVTGSLAGNVNVNAGGVLAGDGPIGAVTVTGGVVAPGSGAGTLETGNFSLDSNAILRFELSALGAGGPNDLISTIGNLTLDGLLDVLALNNLENGSYRLFDYTGTLTDNGLVLPAAFTALYPGSFINTAIPQQVNLVVVPESGALLGLSAGFGLLCGLQRFRRRS